MGHRLNAICDVVMKYEGKEEFFDKYSTAKDSIIEFLKKVEAKGIEL